MSQSTPSIRTFQMDASTVGVLKSSVNLFRGDINYTQSLFSMPGRNSGDGLQIDVSIQYKSNIHIEAMTWNRDQPTGVLGMGWELPLSVIRYDSGGSPIPGTGTYSITLAGVESQMKRDPQINVLFSMGDSIATLLIDNQQVPEALRNQFAQHGLALSPSATVVGKASPWTLRDDVLEQEYLLTIDGSRLVASDGGQLFQLLNYKFWKVIYYPRYERWSVVNESGQVMAFGGGIQVLSPQVNSSIGNSIEWGVQWMDSTGAAVWEGNSAFTIGQRQYAHAWHLVRCYSRFGEYIEYGYNEFERNHDGLLPDVEQRVGQGGCVYTKACYLTSITNVFGHTAHFDYAPKLWSNTNPASPREYADPHKAVPDNTPNGYQDRYENKFLNRITVSHSDGTTLFYLEFTYKPSSGATAEESVANVAQGSSGDTCKRLLTGFALYNQSGECLPGYRFDYYLDTSKTDTNLGALRSITWPTGGSALYIYQKVDLEICQRTITMTPPAPMPTDSTPRVWFGPDYAVVVWHNSGTQQLSLQILSWNGQWMSWQPDPASPLIMNNNGGTSLSALTVLASAEFITLSYNTSNETNLHLFRKEPARPGQWSAAVIPGGGTGGCNSPTWHCLLSEGPVTILAGENFVLSSQMNSSQNKGSYNLFTWNWSTKAWIRTSQITKSYTWFVAGRDYFASVDMSSNVLLTYQSPSGEWYQGGSTNLGFELNNHSSLALASDVSLLAVSHLVSGSAAMGQQSYDLFPLQWNAHYQLPQKPPKFHFLDKFDSNYPTSWAPTVIANTMVAVAGNLLRFNGQAWLVNSNLAPSSASQNVQQRYAYGPDFGTLIRISNGSPTAQLIGYDANSAAIDWTSSVTDITGLTTPPANQSTANWATCNNPDYIIVGTQLFFRGTVTDWGKALKNNITDLQTLVNQVASPANRYQFNSLSVINEAPGFIACALYDNQSSTIGHATAVSALVLRNGGVYGSAQILDHEQMWTSQESGDQPGQGKYPGGSMAFFTYPDSVNNLDAARKVYLHRYAGDAIQGAINDWPVASITIDDGLSESFTTHYVQETKSAGCDSSGKIVKYFKSAVYPGGSPSDQVNGSVVSCYLNGNEEYKENYYNSLDGLLYNVTTFDAQGSLLTSVTNHWSAYVKRADNPTDPAVSPRQLYGAYVLLSVKESVSYGLSSIQTIGYLPSGLLYPYTGQTVTNSTTTWNGAGKQETDIISYMYACEINETSCALNDLSSIVAQTTTQDGVITAQTVTAITPWPTTWGCDVVTPAEEADFCWAGGSVSFPFTSYQPGDIPAGFQLTTRIERRDTTGSVIQQIDGAGTRCSTLFSATHAFPVATFKGAALAECAWCGFQSYEELGTMHPQGASICTDNVWLGTQSLLLPPGSSVSPSVAACASSHYLLGYRYQTVSGYQGNGSLWFSDTNGEWRYMVVPVSPAGGSAPTIDKLFLVNQGNSDVWLDSLLLVPSYTDATVQSWEPRTRQLLGNTTTAGKTSFLLYDNFNRNLGAVGADLQLQELDVRFLSRQGAVNDNFDDASPNAELTLQMSAGGSAEHFRDGGKWALRWQPNNSALWEVVNGMLVKAGNRADQLIWKGGSAQTIAFFFELNATQPLGSKVSIDFGGGNSIGWNPDGSWYWYDNNGTIMQNALAKPLRMAAQWLLVITGKNLLFFGDGQLLFSKACTAKPFDGVQFSTGSNQIVINNLITGMNPRIGLSYTDGAARQRQVQQLYGSDSRVMVLIYDALDRQVASTRVGLGNFGSGSEMPTLQYRSGFVDIPAFISAMKNSWAMHGDLSDYYSGQKDGTIVRSNDQNYPYSGLRYEESAQDRIVESGKPGLQLAIHDINTTTLAQRQTTRTTYTVSGAGDPVDPGRYLAQYTLTPAGYQGRQLVDTSNRAVATVQMDCAGTNVGQTTVAPSYTSNVDSAGSTATLRLPNAFAPGPQSDPASFVRTTLRNPLEQVVCVTDPDGGTIQYLFDGKGQSRFIKVPLEGDENYYHYARYDSLGRILEEGIVSGSWDSKLLVTRVNDQTFPSTTDGAVPARTYHYDGNGNDPNSLGHLTEVVTCNPAPASHSELGDCTVNESWEYDILGRVTIANLLLTGAVNLNANVRYHYNNLNEIVQIDLPDGSPLSAITYSYDDQGQIVAIGVPGSPDAIARYTWSADGQLQSAVRGAVSEVWNFNSPGNVVYHEVCVEDTTLFSQSYTYTPDSQVQTRTTGCAGDTRSVTYSYDGLQRLKSAAVANSKTGNQSITQYDANGNIWGAIQDGEPFTAKCVPGKNQLESALLAEGEEVYFHYRADGNADQWHELAIAYNSALGTTATVTRKEKTVRYARGLNNHRVIRQQGGSVDITLQGAGNTPLVFWRDGTASVCIWGPTGLVALHDGILKYPISDHQMTVWAVADQKGTLIAAFDYLPFGGIISRSGHAAEKWPFLFCGKEWDDITGLYDFGARLYDPSLLRFIAADPARQYASPYVFASNNPINVVDPSGNISVWGQVGIGLAMTLLLVGGIALSMVSFGTAAAPTAAAEGALAGAAAGGEIEMAALGGEAAVAVAAESAGEGAAVGASEIAVGAAAEVAAPLTTAQVVGQGALLSVLQSATSSALTGAGFSGLTYDVTHGRDFTAKGFFEAVGVGALSGFASGGISRLGSLGSLTQGMSVTSSVLFRALTQATASMIGKDVATLLTDAVTGKNVTVGELLLSSAEGFGLGALSGSFSVIKSTSPSAAAFSASDQAIVKVSNLINKVIENTKSAAASQAAIATYIASGFFLTSGYVVWGVYEGNRS